MLIGGRVSSHQSWTLLICLSTGEDRLCPEKRYERQDSGMASTQEEKPGSGALVDRWRSQVYSAEDQFSQLLNRGGVVDFFGSSLDVPLQRRFGDIASVRDYVASVHEQVQAHFADIACPNVRARKGTTQAHYEFSTATIAVPVNDQWALRESVILHEWAHHLTAFTCASPVQAHGREFVANMVALVEIILGESAALLLRAGYQAAQVPIAVVDAAK